MIMANYTDSNITQKVAKGFKPGFESSMVLTKTVDTQTLTGAGLGTPDFGEKVKFKRPMQYRSTKTADGDISSTAKNDLVFGNSFGEVQNFYTVHVDWSIIDEALRLNELDKALEPIGEQLAADIETDFGSFMIEQSGLTYGDVGTAVNAWSDVAGAGAFLDSIGVPKGKDRFYAMNPFSTTNLADTQSGLASGNNKLVDTAWERAQISSRFGGLSAISSNALSSYVSGELAGESGTVSATPVATYVSVKDSYQQTIVLTGLTVSTTGAVKPGDTIEFDDNGRNYINLRTRRTVMGANGQPIKWRATVVTGGDTDGSGNVTVVVAPAAINEGATGQYNNISSPITAGDGFTILGTADTEYQPNLFYHKAAFGIGFVKLPKLYSTDTVMTMPNGISVRVSRYADGDGNRNKMRFDALPAFACFNPLFAGKGWGQ
ncbi:MAG: head protein [Pseudooceanicola sp.]|nr:head protein [Pseudooceanicola sp.]|tara:strand:- start:6242 stop:7540 length:1299 start_codon:yes stop_codon:yes gene_type:complete